MAAWVCVGCTTVYAVGAPRCPHCGSTEYTEQGAADMPKITRHGGPSIAGASVIGGAWGEDAPEHPEEEPSPGTSSKTSPEKPSNSPEPSEKPAPSPARTTGSRSGKGRTGKASTARSTGGGRTDGTSETGSAADEASK